MQCEYHGLDVEVECESAYQRELLVGDGRRIHSRRRDEHQMLAVRRVLGRVVSREHGLQAIYGLLAAAPRV